MRPNRNRQETADSRAGEPAARTGIEPIHRSDGARPDERFVLSDAPNGGPPAWHSLTPPVGFPLGHGDVIHALAAGLAKSRSSQFLARFLADRLGVKWAGTLSSGRAALATALGLLHSRQPSRDEVVLPAFTCFSLASAVIRAGLRVRLVDLGEERFDLDPDELSEVMGPRTLALVAPHLLGYPLDLEPLVTATARVGATLIDDAAQALGARRQGRAAGAGGSLGILSFGRGKPLTALGGGAVLCTDPQLVAPLEKAVSELPCAPFPHALAAALEAALYSPLLHPRIYWLPARIPFLRVGLTEFDASFAIRRLDGVRLGLIMRGLARLEAVNEARRRGAERLRLGLHELPELELIAPPPASHTIYLRYPVIMPSAEWRARAQAELRRAGIGASRLYPAPLTAIPAVAACSPDVHKSFPNANRLASRLLCLPTYPHFDDRLARKTAAILGQIPSDADGRSLEPHAAAGSD